MKLYTKNVSEPALQLFQFPEVLATRDSVWQKLRALDEPAPMSCCFGVAELTLEQSESKGVCLRSNGGGQIPYIAKAVERLLCAHRVDILHGDLKTEHILLRPDGSVRWIDWDFAITVSDGAAGVWGIGTPEFMAPEKVRSGVTNVATEIYSLGRILMEQDEAKERLDVRRLAHECLKESPVMRPSSFEELYSRIQALL